MARVKVMSYLINRHKEQYFIGLLTNETTDTLVVADGATLTLDLLAVDHPGDFTSDVDAANDVPDIWEVITNARGFDLPAYPASL